MVLTLAEGRKARGGREHFPLESLVVWLSRDDGGEGEQREDGYPGMCLLKDPTTTPV
eukprot:COSAG02_NODE_37154_length_445_cov_1.661850_1_plen_56_part_10